MRTERACKPHVDEVRNSNDMENSVRDGVRFPELHQQILEAAGRTATGSQVVYQCIGKYRTDDVGRILPKDPLRSYKLVQRFETVNLTFYSIFYNRRIT